MSNLDDKILAAMKRLAPDEENDEAPNFNIIPARRKTTSMIRKGSDTYNQNNLL